MMMYLTEQIIAYEANELSASEEKELFAELIKTGLCWRSQGHYGRTAEAYIRRGYITAEGVITNVM